MKGHLENDLEAGNGRGRGEYSRDDEQGSGPFDIFRTKSAPVDRLRRWRVSLSHSFSHFWCFFV